VSSGIKCGDAVLAGYAVAKECDAVGWMKIVDVTTNVVGMNCDVKSFLYDDSAKKASLFHNQYFCSAI
jgi:hypothetical protein